MSNLRRSRPRPPEPAGNLHGGQLAAEVAGGVLRASPPPPQLQGDSLHRHVTAHRAAQLQQLGLSEDQLHVLAAQVGPPAPPPEDPPPPWHCCARPGRRHRGGGCARVLSSCGVPACSAARGLSHAHTGLQAARLALQPGGRVAPD